MSDFLMKMKKKDFFKVLVNGIYQNNYLKKKITSTFFHKELFF